MAHPLIRTSARTRTLALLGAAGTLVLAAGPAAAVPVFSAQVALAGTVGSVCDATGPLLDPLAGTCETIEDSVGAVEELAEPVTQPVAPVVEDVIEQVEPAVDPVTEAVTDPLADVVDPVIDALPADALPDALPDVVPPTGDDQPGGAPGHGGEGSDGADSPATGGSGAVGVGSGGGDGAVTDGDAAVDDDKVEAAGKGPEEVLEPLAPAADGRVTSTPTLQPTDLGALGANIAGIGSQTGVTLQPYDADAPLVSIPSQVEMPQVAGAPVTTASPVAAMAAEAMTFAGDVVLPQTTAQAAMVTVTGVSGLVVAAAALRRRGELLSLGSLSDTDG